MRHSLDSRRSAIAFAAILALLVQTLVAGWAGAAMAGQPMLDAFGNPLCIGNTVDHDRAPAGGHGELPDCCALGCMAFSSSFAAPPAAMAEILVPPAVHVAFRPAPLLDGQRSAHRGPGNPRAPPLHI